MFDDVGKKIKGLVKFVFVVLALIGVFIGYLIMQIDEDLGFVGFLVMVSGIVAAWLSTCMVYAYGELVDKTCEIERLLRNGGGNSAAQKPTGDREKAQRLQALYQKGLISSEEYQKAMFGNQ